MLFVQNAFSVVLSPFSFDFHDMLTVDLLHEVELGVWKALLIHLTRMLHACGQETVNEFDKRYGLLDMGPHFAHPGPASEWCLHLVTQSAASRGTFPK
jgi:hypothetical protein